MVTRDVEKAFDKAWLNGILDILYKSGLDDRHWCFFKKINEENYAIIDTHMGFTRKITIKDNLKQGGVLSGLAYSAFTDQIAKELVKFNIGYELDDNNKIPCLLWMDDTLAMEKRKSKIQDILNIINE